jgi:hypothetical protein
MVPRVASVACSLALAAVLVVAAQPAGAFTPVTAAGLVHLAPGWATAGCFTLEAAFEVDVDAGTGSLVLACPTGGSMIMPYVIREDYGPGECQGALLEDITCYRTYTQQSCETKGHGKKAQTTCTTQTVSYPETVLTAGGWLTYSGYEGQLVRAG